MSVWDLSRIRYTVRKLTGKFDTNQLPDVSPGPGAVSVQNPPGIDDYINDFYLYDLDEEFRTLKLKDFFTFPTIPNVGTYNLPQNINQVEPPIYVDGYQFAWYQSPEQFYRIWPELDFIDQNLFDPDGTTSIFSFTLTQTPVQQGSVVIGLQPNQDGTPSPQLETFQDQDTPALLDQPLLLKFTNPGTLISNLYSGTLPPPAPGVTPGTGTIDYLTGVVTLSYVNAPPAGINTSCHYHPYVASRSRDIMFFQQQLFLRPIPNDTYMVKFLAYFQPVVAINNLTNSPTFYPGNVSQQVPGVSSQFNGDNILGSTSMSCNPQFSEWWQLITYGTAMKILAEEGDWDEYQALEIIFERQKMLAQRKTLKQLATQRIQTAYAENQGGMANWPIYPQF